MARKQGSSEAPGRPRNADAARTRQDILAVARAEFAEHGLSGARVDAIAARMRTTKRMIYYYFGSKDGLYLAVLEQAYADIRALEQSLDLDTLAPEDALRRIVAFTFSYHEAHPDFVRLVSIENIHHGRHVAASQSVRNLNVSIISTLTRILERGREVGVFHRTIDPIDLHMLISAFCFYRVSNRHTFGTLFRRDLADPATRRAHQRLIEDTILALLRGEVDEAQAMLHLPAIASADAPDAPRR